MKAALSIMTSAMPIVAGTTLILMEACAPPRAPVAAPAQATATATVTAPPDATPGAAASTPESSAAVAPQRAASPPATLEDYKRELGEVRAALVQFDVDAALRHAERARDVLVEVFGDDTDDIWNGLHRFAVALVSRLERTKALGFEFAFDGENMEAGKFPDWSAWFTVSVPGGFEAQDAQEDTYAVELCVTAEALARRLERARHGDKRVLREAMILEDKLGAVDEHARCKRWGAWEAVRLSHKALPPLTPDSFTLMNPASARRAGSP
jgi:hypothetical protein